MLRSDQNPCQFAIIEKNLFSETIEGIADDLVQSHQNGVIAKHLDGIWGTILNGPAFPLIARRAVKAGTLILNNCTEIASGR